MVATAESVQSRRDFRRPVVIRELSRRVHRSGKRKRRIDDYRGNGKSWKLRHSESTNSKGVERGEGAKSKSKTI